MEDGNNPNKCSASIGLIIDKLSSMKLTSSSNANNDNNERDWDRGMIKELLTKIVEHVEHFEDFETMFWVCSSWRRAAYDATFGRACLYNKKDSNIHTLPWLLLPKNSMDRDHNRCRFYSLSNRMFRCVYLPVNTIGVYTFLSSHGWLLLTSLEGRGQNICLFNPYSGNTIIPPPIKLSNPVHRGIPFVASKFVLSANPSTTLEYVVFLALEAPCLNNVPSMLAFWRNGYDAGWIQVTEPPTPPGPGLAPPQHTSRFHDALCHDIAYYQGEFYGVNFYGHVVKFQTLQGKPHFQLITKLETGFEDSDDIHPNRRRRSAEKCYYYYLVESKGQLLVIAQEVQESLDIKNTNDIFICPKRFEVFELNVKNGTLKPVLSLGNRSIFTGLNSSYSMEVSTDEDHGFKSNCIYNTNDRVTWAWAGRGYGMIDACVYNLSDGMIERLYHGPSKPSWLTSFMWVESPHPSDEISYSR